MSFLGDRLFSLIDSIIIEPFFKDIIKSGQYKKIENVLEQIIKKKFIDKYSTKEFYNSFDNFLEGNEIIKEFIKRSYNYNWKEYRDHTHGINCICDNFINEYPQYNIYKEKINDILNKVYDNIFNRLNDRTKLDEVRILSNIFIKEISTYNQKGITEYEKVNKECALDRENNEKTIIEESQLSYVIQTAEKHKNTFVKPSFFKELLKLVDQDRPIILLGDSGIGKSLTSIILAHTLRDNYKITFIDGINKGGEQEIRELIKSIKQTISENEIILFDDFLGKTKLNDSSEYLLLIEELIKIIKNCSCKKLILNSRKTIFEYAKKYRSSLEAYLTNDSKVFDREKWYEDEERVYILRNYISKNAIEDKIEKLLLDTITLINIIVHENFTPLIIDRATQNCQTKDSEEVGQTILNFLNNPQDLWENEVSALDDNALNYLLVLSSLSNTFIKKDIVDECYKEFRKKNNIKQTELLEDTKKVLDALISYDNEGNIKFRHPSLIDYLSKKVLSNEELYKKDKLILGAIYFEQIENLDDNKEKIIELLYNPNEFFKLKTLPINIFNRLIINFPNYIYVKYIQYVFSLDIREKKFEDIILMCIKKIFICEPIRMIFAADDILNIISMKYYNLNLMLTDREFIGFMYDFSSAERVWEIIENTIAMDNGKYDFLNIDESIQDKILSKIENLIECEVDKIVMREFNDYLKENVENYEDEDEDYEYIAEEIINMIVEDIDFEEIKANIIKKAQEHKIYNLDLDDIQYEYEYDTYIEEFAIDKIEECFSKI